MGTPMKKSLQEATTPYAYSPLPLDDSRSDSQTDTDTLNEETQGSDKASIDGNGAYPFKCPQCPPTPHTFTHTNVPGTPFLALANAKITIHAPDGIKSHYIDDKTVVCDIGPRGSVTVCAGGPSPVNPATLLNAAYSPEGLHIDRPRGHKAADLNTSVIWVVVFRSMDTDGDQRCQRFIAPPTEMSETKIT
ncbi:hypothetical protein NLJ89_g5854 [Agrocybe chaxingu]|uniref:Uncharacterized protein n=1 Tax=Agrocybe chaxingu TaxID=84603 RepID=A0A9W8K0A7_9AGAR|nr:hypothetical protein NLJ89_g5854 [Agrocybe chaxingu]